MSGTHPQLSATPPDEVQNDVRYGRDHAIEKVMDEIISFEDSIRQEYPRLLRLCTALTGSPTDADDLAQEVLLEAWRSRAALREQTVPFAWISAIARNVYLRWRRAQGRAAARTTRNVILDHLELADDIDLELEIERRDLTALLDVAMGRLPAGTRSVLTERYVDDLPVREMAARRGVSEGAVSLHLHRGRRALKRVLSTDLSDEIAAMGLLDPSPVDWESTRIWCSVCGTNRLQARRDVATTMFAARCVACSMQWTDHTAVYLDEVKGPWRTLRRMNREAHKYYRDAMSGTDARCVCCGQRAHLVFSLPPGIPGDGLHVRCDGCGATSVQPRIGLVLTLPEVDAFWREQGRIRLTHEYQVDHEGRPATVTWLESVGSVASLHILSDNVTFAVLQVERTQKPGRSII